MYKIYLYAYFLSKSATIKIRGSKEKLNFRKGFRNQKKGLKALLQYIYQSFKISVLAKDHQTKKNIYNNYFFKQGLSNFQDNLAILVRL